jgi:uncharacterized protein YkwD
VTTKSSKGCDKRNEPSRIALVAQACSVLVLPALAATALLAAGCGRSDAGSSHELPLASGGTDKDSGEASGGGRDGSSPRGRAKTTIVVDGDGDGDDAGNASTAGNPRDSDNSAGAGGDDAGGGTDDAPATTRYCLDAVNALRAKMDRKPLALDATLSSFALDGNQPYSDGGEPHAHFQAEAHGALQSGIICGTGGENQGVATGASVEAAIDRILQAMWAEGPGGGHYDAIINPDYALIGISILVKNDHVYLTNDFSGPCP